MRRFLYTLLALTLLSACQPIVLAATATPTKTPATATITPTLTLTETPTFVLTPTESEPKAGDTKVENGFTYTYTEIKSSGGKEYLGYFRQLGKDLPLWDLEGYYVAVLNPDGKSVAKNADGSYQWQQAKNIAPINVFVELGADTSGIQSITHSPRPGTLQTTPDYIGRLSNEIFKHYLPSSAPTRDTHALLDAALQAGLVTYTITDGANTYTFPLSPTSGATIYAINSANATKDNGFTQWVDGLGDHNFSTAFWGADQKGLIGAIASETPLSMLSDSELMMLPLWHLTVAMDHPNVTDVGYSDVFFQGMVQFTIVR